ncbi:hypothetical protein M0R45_006062 [Rubus argutus]|uniref:Pentatricopeptide repeat-containing protein n=1 Tax=Rubus argutus TaxID=59490 RepID=A0AAW1YPV8_RUBAR
MEEKGIVPDSITYNILINGYCRSGNAKKAFSLHDDMLRKRDRADQVRDEMLSIGFNPTLLTYNALVQGLCKNQEGDLAEGLLKEMLIVFASIMSALAETCFQTSLPAALALSISVVFMLWVPRFVPKGCVVNFIEGRSENMIGSSVTCELSEADFRARVLANLQFSWILSGILIFTAYTCLKFAGKCMPSDLSVEYGQRHSSRGADVPMAINDFKEAST